MLIAARTEGLKAGFRVGCCVGLSVLLPGAGCSGPQREVKQVVAAPLRDVPDVYRGTIGAEASINGTEPQLVSGLGLVVNLNGTGGGEIRPDVFTTMERELARNGVGRGGNAGGAIAGMSPQEFLRSPNVAVVIVEARIPPGAPEGTVFDVAVRILPGSTVTSLEGGTLWTTDLRLGPATTFGGYKTRKLAEAKGPIYVNPFTEPGTGGPSEVAVTRTTGRVLGGGRVTDPLKMELVLDSDSHSRARSVIASVNSRFPRDPGETGLTARGRGNETLKTPNAEEVVMSQSVAISIPKAYKDSPADFLQLLRYTRVDQGYPQEFARRYVEELKGKPAMSESLSWCLKAIGKTSVPFLSSMYEYPEYLPRMAALDAGAFHGDPRVVPHLIDMAKTAPSAVRMQAIRLMSKMPGNPSINLALRELVDAPELEIRVAAYEGLRERNDPLVSSRPIGIDPNNPKFILETVVAEEPMVYVTQQGKPRIVIFGGGIGTGTAPSSSRSQRDVGIVRMTKPSLVTAWGDRFILSSDCSECEVRLLYRSVKGGKSVTSKVSDDLAEFVTYLAQKPTPEEPAPGLDLSYSEVVGLLYEMSRQSGVAATFATEQDRLRAEIYEASQATALNDRPEDSETQGESVTVFKPTAPSPLTAVDNSTSATDKPRIVPLAKPAGKPKKPAAE